MAPVGLPEGRLFASGALCLSFFTCKMGMTKEPAIQVVVMIKHADPSKVLRTETRHR